MIFSRFVSQFRELGLLQAKTIISNRSIAFGCPGQFIFDEILWRQGPALMPYFWRNSIFSRNSQDRAGNLPHNRFGITRSREALSDGQIFVKDGPP